jgi:FMN phosphatase YigB (HAD superfamily)
VGREVAGRADLEGQKTLSRYRWIVFDADGTLFDFDAAERKDLAATLRFFGVEPSPEIGMAEPDPRYLDEAFSRMGHPPRSEVLMVGDGLSSDIAGAAESGVDSCWFNPSNAVNGPGPQPTYTIAHLTDPTDIVEPCHERMAE